MHYRKTTIILDGVHSGGDMKKKIDILLPTRGRPDRLRNMLKTVVTTCDDLDNIRVGIALDADDQALDNIKAVAGSFVNLNIFWIIRDKQDKILSNYWNDLCHATDAEIVMYASDDIEFKTRGWDILVREAFEEVPDEILLAWGWCKFQPHNATSIATHGFVSRKSAEILGYLFPPYFATAFNDTWLTEVYKSIGRTKYFPDMVIEHFHGRRPGMQNLNDELYRYRFSFTDESRHIWKGTASERLEDAKKLKGYIDAFQVSQ